MEENLQEAAGGIVAVAHAQILANMVVALCAGVLIALVYRFTHRGVSYSQSFTQTIVFVSVIVAIVIMVVGSDLARAFALMGAMSIIRFRTIMKDTKDTAYVFAGLAVGLAAGTSNYFIAVTGTLFVCALAIALHRFNFGGLHQGMYVLRFFYEQAGDRSACHSVMDAHATRHELVNAEPTPDGRLIRLTYDISLRKSSTAEKLAGALGELESASEVSVIATKNEVDF